MTNNHQVIIGGQYTNPDERVFNAIRSANEDEMRLVQNYLILNSRDFEKLQGKDEDEVINNSIFTYTFHKNSAYCVIELKSGLKICRETGLLLEEIINTGERCIYLNLGNEFLISPNNKRLYKLEDVDCLPANMDDFNSYGFELLYDIDNPDVIHR